MEGWQGVNDGERGEVRSSPPFLPYYLTSLPHLSHLATSPLSPTCPTLLPHPSLPYRSHLASPPYPSHLTSLPIIHTLPPFHLSQLATSPYSYLSTLSPHRPPTFPSFAADYLPTFSARYPRAPGFNRSNPHHQK